MAGTRQGRGPVVHRAPIRLSAPGRNRRLNDESQKPRASLLAPLRHPTFRAIWVATLGLELRRADPGGRRRLDDDDDHHLRKHGGAGAGLDHAADHGLLAGRRARSPTTSTAARSCWSAQFFMLAVSVEPRARRLDRAADALGAARLHLPDRLRHRAQQPVLAGLGRRHGAARRPAGGGGAEQRRLQPHAQRRPGDRRRDRRHRRRRRRLRRQRLQLLRADRRAHCAGGRRSRSARCRARASARRWARGCATSRCRRTSSR